MLLSTILVMILINLSLASELSLENLASELQMLKSEMESTIEDNQNLKQQLANQVKETEVLKIQILELTNTVMGLEEQPEVTHQRTRTIKKERNRGDLKRLEFGTGGHHTNTSIAFSVAYKGAPLHLGDHQVIEYNNVYTNIGNTFDTRHSHFIAPVKGIYILSFTGMDSGTSDAYLEMVQNGQVISMIYLAIGTNMGSQTTVELLEKGDVVWIRHGYQGSASPTLNGSGPYNTFMGVLLMQTN